MVATKTDHWVVVASDLAHPSGELNSSSRLGAVGEISESTVGGHRNLPFKVRCLG